nr:MAG TPA: hypothetical protein [Caudoviricetes sp.]
MWTRISCVRVKFSNKLELVEFRAQNYRVII